jgi:hypothetical protein
MRISCTLLLMTAFLWPDVASKHLPSGVQENTITQEMLLDKLDCNYCSLSPYTEFITFDRICECKGEYLFVGAFNLDNSERTVPYLVGAFGKWSDICLGAGVAGTPKSNGVQWIVDPTAGAFAFGAPNHPLLLRWQIGADGVK